ncbi:hypothetical protein BK126_15020 [Paenibacillus sp. FSL H7-0326]|uniref:hypothetical protein n=1 Tax=Paenibacillus sp. FSL H7-0326 TaxID=1921144 RepID=UPI00096D4A7E|nr:hypothetical protein [Paenibacillus sp. FSL H7-0326]OMC69085.1 hypothetical protein BK126_15020 [Paenibacillus sp. FSL H7-0326]
MTTLSSLNLTKRQVKKLKERGIYSIEQLTKISGEELVVNYRYTNNSVRQISLALQEIGFSLKKSAIDVANLVTVDALIKTHLLPNIKVYSSFFLNEMWDTYFIEFNGKRYIHQDNIPRIKACIIESFRLKNELDAKGEPDFRVAYRWGIERSKFREEIESGIWDEFIIGKRDAVHGGETTYYFNSEALNKLEVNDLPTLTPKIPNANYSVLKEWRLKGWIVQPERYKGTRLWELSDLKKQVINAKKIAEERIGLPARLDGYAIEELVGPSISSIIEVYLEERRIGNPIIDPWFGNRYGKINDLEQHRLQLHRAIYKMICYDAEIIGYEEVNQRNTFRQLNKEEEKRFIDARHNFSIREIEKKHIDAVRRGIKSDYVWHKTASIFLKPFILWQFKNIELEVDETVERERLIFLNAKKKIRSVIEKLTFEKPEPEYKRTKVFLSREENILIFDFLKKVNTAHATAWLCGSLAGIRPEEISQLKIEYFSNPITGESWLDDDGYLKPDPRIKTFYNDDGTVDENYGYVRLFLPSRASKDQNAPSDEQLGTLIPPALVNQINKYLREEIYSVCSRRGMGYLFRRVNALHVSRLKGHYSFIYTQREKMTFLPPIKRKSLILKDARRCMNNTINRGIVNVPGINQMILLRAAQVQMRHKQNGMIGAISEVHYTEKITDAEYVAVISNTIEYPLNRKELIKWELEKGYRTPEEIPDDLKSEIFVTNAVTASSVKQGIEVAQVVVPEQAIILQNLYQDLNDEFNRLNGILLLPTRKRKQSLAELNMTADVLYEKMYELENKMNVIKREISQNRGA